MDSLALEIAPGDAHPFGGNALPFEILHGPDGRVLGDDQDPAGGAYRGAGVGELGQILQVCFVFIDPVVTGDSTVEKSVVDVGSDLLGPDHEDIELVIIG